MVMQMTKPHMERVRLDDAEEGDLVAIAKVLDISKSEVLRRGIQEMKEVAERVQARRKNWHLLIEAAEKIPGDDVRPEGRV